MDSPAPSLPQFEPALAARFVGVALTNTGTELPFHLSHLVRCDADLAPPRVLYPLFHGSYDWHSCVHMHWTLARCLRRHPKAGFASAARAHFDARFTAMGVVQEIAYFAAPGRASFERPYGWAWLLKLQAELIALAAHDTAAVRWRDVLTPLAQRLADRLLDHLPLAQFAVRAGTHGNSAFALLLALDYADATGHRALVHAIGQRAQRWFGGDQRYPADYEPSGEDFLSGGLTEARLMQRVLDDRDFADWWQAFAPPAAALVRWLAPVPVSDPEDPKIVHLHGLNLSRAWCWRGLRPLLPTELHAAVDAAIAAHFDRSLTTACDGHYVGTHWLATFALLALDDAD